MDEEWASHPKIHPTDPQGTALTDMISEINNSSSFFSDLSPGAEVTVGITLLRSSTVTTAIHMLLGLERTEKRKLRDVFRTY